MTKKKIIFHKPKSKTIYEYEWVWDPSAEWWELRMVTKKARTIKSTNIVCERDFDDWVRVLEGQGWRKKK